MCTEPTCSVSTGIHQNDDIPMSGLTFGHGELDDLGYWEFPCAECARSYEKKVPESKPCWPFEETENKPSQGKSP